MSVIDFRARPNTPEYMKAYTGPGSARMWDMFGNPPPADGSLQEFVGELDRLAITRAVFTGRQSVSNGELVRGVSNDYVAECVAQFPDRLVGVAGLDPTAGPVAALREFERAVRDLGLQGVSLDPDSAGIMPDDRLLYPIYAKAAELNVPVILTMGPLAGRYADPWAVDRAVADFPEVTFVCSHGVWPHVTELISLPYRRENVYLEASIYEFLPGAEPLIAAAGSLIQDRVVYASAFPFNPLDTIERFRALPIDPAVLPKLLYENAARILGLAAS